MISENPEEKQVPELSPQEIAVLWRLYCHAQSSPPDAIRFNYENPADFLFLGRGLLQRGLASREWPKTHEAIHFLPEEMEIREAMPRKESYKTVINAPNLVTNPFSLRKEQFDEALEELCEKKFVTLKKEKKRGEQCAITRQGRDWMRDNQALLKEATESLSREAGNRDGSQEAARSR